MDRVEQILTERYEEASAKQNQDQGWSFLAHLAAGKLNQYRRGDWKPKQKVTGGATLVTMEKPYERKFL